MLGRDPVLHLRGLGVLLGREGALGLWVADPLAAVRVLKEHSGGPAFVDASEEPHLSRCPSPPLALGGLGVLGVGRLQLGCLEQGPRLVPLAFHLEVVVVAHVVG